MSDYEKCGGALWFPKSQLHTKCLRCGRRLKTEEAQMLGYGKVCWEKHLTDKQTTLF